MRSNLPIPAQFVGEVVDGDFMLVELIGTGCNALVFRGYSETLKYNAAFKVIPSANLAHGDAWKIEPQKANSLAHSSVVHCLGHEDWRKTKGCVVLKYDHVDGISLRSYIKQHRDQVTVSFVRAFLTTMLDLFYEMRERGLEHGDFHSGNVLVTKRSTFQRNSVEQFRVTDFGTGGLTSDAQLLDDYEQLARVLAELLACLDYQKLAPEEKYLFNVLNDHFVGKHLVEKDTTLDPLARNPDGLLTRLERVDADYRAAVSKGERATILTPFDYLSCEQIGVQHSLLHALYSDKFLGISEIEGANNLVVTGPRGCGKSTVFRSLSLKHQLAAAADGWREKRYFGIYYHCDDLYFKFPRYRTPERAEAIDLPLHYLTARLLIEILDAVAHLASLDRSIAEGESGLCRGLWDLLGLSRPQLPGADSFRTLIAALTKECQWAVEKQRFASTGDQPVKQLYGPDRLLEVCERIQRDLPLLTGKPFYCFIDEYSIPKISEDLQRNLNRLLMRRNEFLFFKMATESPVSFVSADIDGKLYVEGREFEVLNLGLIYLRGEKERKLDFLDDVFARRLTAVPDYPVRSLHDLVGDGEEASHNEMAERIARGEKLEWWGRNALGNMCSGDIHQLITLVRKMVSDVGGQEVLASSEEAPRIQPRIQNRAIRAHAGDFLQSLADSGAHGERLRKIVTAFGNVAHSYIKFKRSKNEQGEPRHQASRIELHEAPELEGEAKEIYELLLRYSVFIQDPRGKSRRGQPIPRLYLRRFLIPHFNLTFSHRDSVPFEADEFREFLLDPAAYENAERLRKQAKDDDGPSSQHELDFLTHNDDEPPTN